jgi:hypothetical protein
MSVGERAPEKLPEAAESLLGNWNVPDRDWESSAAAIEAKLAGVAPGSTDSALLEAPLPREPEEGEIKAEARAPAPAPAAPAQSLAALARATVRRTSKEEEAANIAKETFAVTSARRGPSADLVERVQAAARAAEPRPAADPVPDEAPRASGVISRLPAKQSSNLPIVYGTGVALLGLAAGLVLFIQSRRAPEHELSALAPAPVAQGAEAPRAEGAKPEPPGQQAEAARAQSAPEPAPAAPAPLAKEASAARAVAAVPVPSASVASGPAPEQIVLEEDAPAPAGAPAPQAAPPVQDKHEPAMRPAEGSAGAVAQKPSIGAVQAALGSVMGGARSCVAGHAEPSRAQVVFGSDGTVQSVAVSGPAAGTAAGACIETALKKARMQPFAVPTFSTSVTIRPP